MENLGPAALRLLWLFLLRLRVARAAWPATLIQGIVVPSIFLFVLAHQSHSVDIPRAAIGLSIVATMTLAARRVAHQGVSDKVTGRIELLRTSCASDAERFLAALIDGCVVGSVALAPLLLAILTSAASAPMSAAWLLYFVAGLPVFALLGVLAGNLVSRMSEVNMITGLAILLCAAVCPLFYGPERVPAIARGVVDLLPPSIEANAMAAAWRTGRIEVLAILELAGWSAILLPVVFWPRKPTAGTWAQVGPSRKGAR